MTVDNSLNLYFFIINYFNHFKATGFLNFFKLSQLISFYSDKKPIYEILCHQAAHRLRVKQAKFHKSNIFHCV